MNLRVITEKEGWDNWARQNDASFLQSWEWGEILLAERKIVERLAVVDGSEILAQAQMVYSRIPFLGMYAFCPGGPIVKEKIVKNKEQAVYEVLENYLRSKQIVFFRFEPPLFFIPYSLLFRKTFDVTPRATTALEITKSEEDLLGAMHEKTRYNIRLAQKKALAVETEKNFEVFWQLMRITGERDGFRLHEEKHYRAIMASPLSHQLTIRVGQEAVATGLFIGFGGTFTYLFGASDYERRALMAPYLIQWEGIKLGKKLGYMKYDFFGIAPASGSTSAADSVYRFDPTHQYAGVTRFKLGFGGATLEHPGTYDLIISSGKYRIYEILRRLRRLV